VSAGSPFSYAIYRIVPRVERGECVNVGVVVFARTLDYLGATVAGDAFPKGCLEVYTPDRRGDARPWR